MARTVRAGAYCRALLRYRLMARATARTLLARRGLARISFSRGREKHGCFSRSLHGCIHGGPGKGLCARGAVPETAPRLRTLSNSGQHSRRPGRFAYQEINNRLQRLALAGPGGARAVIRLYLAVSAGAALQDGAD